MGPITDLLEAKVTCIGFDNAYKRTLGYVIIQVQVDGVQGYDEDQIALVILDLSYFAAWIPIISGTPTISCIINVMKETEIDVLAMPWMNVRVAYLLSVHRMTAIKVGDGTAEESSSDDYDQVMFTQNVETIEAFSSMWCWWKWKRPTWEDVSTSWPKPYGLKMAPCHGASSYKTHTQSWGKEVKR